MRTAASSLILLAAPALAQEVADCDPVPPVTALVEPWDETSATLGAGAIRLAVVEGAGGQELLVLTLPPPDEPEGDAPAAPPERRCRIVADGGSGFAGLDLAGVTVEEEPVAAALTARLPALRFVPESTELEEVTLILTFGVGDDSLSVVIEEPEAPADATEAPDAEEPATQEDGPEASPEAP